MARRKEAEQATDVSSLPEKFEDFERRLVAKQEQRSAELRQHLDEVKSANAPKRRSTPAVKPAGMAEKKKRPTADDVEGVGGMVEKRWSGIQMWACPKCNGTTFNAQEAKIHKCKQVKYADEEGLAD